MTKKKEQHKKVRTTIYIDEDLWREFRIKALRHNTCSSSLLEELIRNNLKEVR
jgi:hypothetical protein